MKRRAPAIASRNLLHLTVLARCGLNRFDERCAALHGAKVLLRLLGRFEDHFPA